MVKDVAESDFSVWDLPLGHMLFPALLHLLPLPCLSASCLPSYCLLLGCGCVLCWCRWWQCPGLKTWGFKRHWAMRALLSWMGFRAVLEFRAKAWWRELIPLVLCLLPCDNMASLPLCLGLELLCLQSCEKWISILYKFRSLCLLL